MAHADSLIGINYYGQFRKIELVSYIKVQFILAPCVISVPVMVSIHGSTIVSKSSKNGIFHAWGLSCVLKVQISDGFRLLSNYRWPVCEANWLPFVLHTPSQHYEFIVNNIQSSRYLECQTFVICFQTTTRMIYCIVIYFIQPKFYSEMFPHFVSKFVCTKTEL